ncbi:COG4235 Cytochrome c biogenesis factor [Vibrio sp. B1REV9]|uniref:tetratricopeptide repeat protein n=1 Tax=Vibrio sp. B1REV9 TaxID=2751179 RepID=UPI001B0D737A|nr:tetratricopeptide repeat protein [Vibrio sp. B1REV9]CAE6947707.1 COG4235 Cytochrome c biogenesis factor [Vibrio sp. B1REV9]
MSVWFFVAITLMGLFIAVLLLGASKVKSHQWLGICALIVVFTSVSFLYFRQTSSEPAQAEMSRMMAARDIMEEIQTQLREAPNNAELWFQLGQSYLMEGELDGALICFDYAIQLTDPVDASQLAAKATTLYYLYQQSMTDEVSLLLDQALQIEPHNEAALSLIANDHFLSFRFQEAIDTWIILLDSNDPSLDRAQIINSNNQTKVLM